jgi:hypothetical protein
MEAIIEESAEDERRESLIADGLRLDRILGLAPGWNHADELHVLGAGIAKAVFLPRGDKDHGAGLDGGLESFLEDDADSFEYENLMLPGMAVMMGLAPWLHLYHPHVEIGGPILLADDPAQSRFGALGFLEYYFPITLSHQHLVVLSYA